LCGSGLILIGSLQTPRAGEGFHFPFGHPIGDYRTPALWDSSGFFRDENIDLEYRVLRADIGVNAMLNGEVDYIYSAGTATRASIRGLPIRALSYDLERLLHF